VAEDILLATVSPPEHIPTRLDTGVYNLLSMKRFQGVLVGNVHNCLLKTSIGKASLLILEALTAWPSEHREKGKTMAEPQETRQKQEARWTAQRAARDKEFIEGQKARQKKRRQTWLTVGVIVIIAAVTLL
jgi:hypothetical protein